MTKKQFIIVAVALGLVVIFLIIMIWVLQIQREQQANPPPPPSPTPTISFNVNEPTSRPTVTTAPQLAVVKIDPADKATNIPTNTRLTIAFNRNFSSKDVIFSIAPRVEFSQVIIGKTLQISFPKGLQASTLYTYKVNTLTQVPRTYTFSTAGSAEVVPPNTYPVGAAEVEEEYQRQNNPDIFLRNNTPYEEEEFAVTSEYDEARDTFVFTVTSKVADPAVAKQAFMDWLNTLRLKPDQIQQLIVTYE